MSNAYPFPCPRCGSDAWSHCDYGGCSDCRPHDERGTRVYVAPSPNASTNLHPPRTEERVPDHDALAESIVELAKAFNAYIDAANDYAAHVSRELTRLWADNAAIRDEVNTLAKRVAVLEERAGLIFRGLLRVEREL